MSTQMEKECCFLNLIKSRTTENFLYISRNNGNRHILLTFFHIPFQEYISYLGEITSTYPTQYATETQTDWKDNDLFYGFLILFEYYQVPNGND